MPAPPIFDRCLQFINSESRRIPPSPFLGQNGERQLAITISRQSGCGAHRVADYLADYMQARIPGTPAWTVFDQNLVEQILREHDLPTRLVRFIPEDRVADLSDALDELFGLHPSFWTLLQQTAETISRLADRGNCILIGRGAHIITSGRQHVFHARLVSYLAKRIEHIQEIRGINKDEALAVIRHEDRGRRRYLKTYFGKDIDDPLSYHLVVNTGLVSYQAAARLIGDAALITSSPIPNSNR